MLLRILKFIGKIWVALVLVAFAIPFVFILSPLLLFIAIAGLILVAVFTGASLSLAAAFAVGWAMWWGWIVLVVSVLVQMVVSMFKDAGNDIPIDKDKPL